MRNAGSSLEEILVTCLEQLDDGRTPDLLELCEGDTGLVETVATILKRDQSLARELASGKALKPVSEVHIPKRIDDFEILGKLGAGGMGVVLLAEQVSLKRRVALKVVHVSEEDSTRTLRFRREAEVTAALHHPNIVPVYACGQKDDLAWIAMKLLEGRSLAESQLPLEPTHAARIGAAIGRALHAAHAIGVVHRDVKPGNVILENGIPYILDFGLARARSDETLTDENSAPGTLVYMAPEQLKGGSIAIAPTIDVYGLGATLYELVSGYAPFRGTPSELVHRIIFAPVRRPLLASAHRDLWILLEKSLAKSPHHRFQSTLEFAEDLDRFASGLPIRTRPRSRLSRLLGLARRHPLITTLTMMVVILALFLGDAYRREQAAKQHAREEREQRLEERAKNLSLAHAELARTSSEGDYLEMRRLLRGTQVRFPEDSFHQETIDAEALELADLLLTLSLFPDQQGTPADLIALSEELSQLESEVVETPRVQWTRLFIDVLAWKDRTRDADRFRERARIQLSRLESLKSSYPRSLLAFRSLLDHGGTVSREVVQELMANPVPSEAADDHLFTSLALRSSHVKRRIQRTELELARREGLPDHACQSLLAQILAEDGNFEAAEQVLHGLESHPWHRPLALIDIARLTLAAGKSTQRRRVAEQYREAEHALREHTRPEWRHALLLLQLEILKRFGEDEEEFFEKWKDASETFGRMPEYWMLSAERAAMEGDFDRSIAMYGIALKLDPEPMFRHELRLALLNTELMAQQVRGADENALARLLERIPELLEQARQLDRPRAEATLLALQATLCFMMGRYEDCLPLLERSCSLRDTFVGTRLYVHQVDVSLQYPEVYYPDDPRRETAAGLAPLACSRIRRLFSPEWRGDPCPQDEVPSFVEYLGKLSVALPTYDITLDLETASQIMGVRGVVLLLSQRPGCIVAPEVIERWIRSALRAFLGRSTQR